jgi:hypothetical protein
VRSQQRGKTAEVPGIFSEMTFILSTGFQEKEKIQNILEDKTNNTDLSNGNQMKKANPDILAKQERPH